MVMWLPKDERILVCYYYSQCRADHICQRDHDAIIKELYEIEKYPERQIIKAG